MTEFYDSCEGFNLWINLILTIIISPTLLIIKIIWDRCSRRRRETIIMNNKLHLEKLTLKLQNFYWPIYIRLVKNYTIWARFLEHVNRETENLSEYSDSDDENLAANSGCDYIHNQRICGEPIYKNSDKKRCLKHMNILRGPGVNTYEEGLYKYFKNQLLENYREINKLIIRYIYISEPNTKLGKMLIYYMKFALVIIGLIETNQQLHFKKYNLKYPQRLLPMIETKLFKLQKDYNSRLLNYYYKD